MTDELSTAISAEQSPASIETERHDALEKTEATLDNSIDAAFDKAFSDAPKSESKAYERDETGRFAPKATEAAATAAVAPETPAAPVAVANAIEAPTRFSADAKAAWATTPEPVKAEIGRAFTEMERGLQEYQARYAPLKPYEDMAKQHGTTVETALQNYTNMESMLERDPIAAFEKICNFIGETPQQFFARIQGQQQQSQNTDPMVANLRQQVGQLQEQLSSVSTTIQSQQDQELEQRISAWAQDKPRFNELRDTMAQLAQSNMATDLDQAYEMASRLKPASAPSQTAVVQPKLDLKAQTQKGQLSTTGAPVSGSNPAFRKPASSATDAIDRAFSMAGIG